VLRGIFKSFIANILCLAALVLAPSPLELCIMRCRTRVFRIFVARLITKSQLLVKDGELPALGGCSLSACPRMSKAHESKRRDRVVKGSRDETRREATRAAPIITSAADSTTRSADQQVHPPDFDFEAPTCPYCHTVQHGHYRKNITTVLLKSPTPRLHRRHYVY
jgi:hypothetical protein